MAERFDTIIRGGRVFDGSGGPSRLADVGIRGGKIAAISDTPLDAAGAGEVIDAQGQWVTPGFIDIHTHYDAEMILDPALAESVRHGVTTCFVGSCSISMIYSDPEDASDIFTRVESIPREYVLPVLEKTKTWKDSKGYVDFLKSQPFGPNIVSYMGHSDLRVAVMGLGRSVDPKDKPTEAELQQMERHLHEGLDLGLIGMSSMTNPWDKVDGERYRSSALPSVYARWSEYRRLHALLRKRGAILQSAPNLTNPLNALFFMVTSASLALRRTLRTTLITLLDVKTKPRLDIVMSAVTRVFNKVMGASFKWQILPQPFLVYADGIDFVIFEEFPAGEVALHLKKDFDRNKLFSNPAYREAFKKDYQRKWGGRVWHRDFGDAHVISAPDASLVGKTIRQIAQERNDHEVNVFLDLLIDHGKALRWSTLIGNHNPARVAVNVNADCGLVGFSDAGAHLRNMAFYNFGLCMLQLAVKDEPVMSPEKAVWRLTGEIADWYGINAGRLEVGARADVVVLDPQMLKNSRLMQYAEEPMAVMGGLVRVVNRSDGVVKATLINGHVAFRNDVVSPELGRVPKFGSYLPREVLAQ
ncbi:N-acyl-D-amino-acid deacylase family protein [Rhodoferax saidenbachensis]|uniref:N-acyl-D-glutamate amidohydrolase n=1 Tax=Rhodoferax saidenbachensis TaxID=1484693 RepID=A0A1P8KAL1_9BURK|nr:amidohydrolase family protein [Rhodoferax saidenbachensis]APW43023.1 N-acyl-D-glutamate amidohydrolase [Rhodoferax saidenbachensis]